MADPFRYRPEMPHQAFSLRVRCGGCGADAHPRRVIGIVDRPQHDGVSAYAIVGYGCDTPDCGDLVPLEVDLS